MKKKPIPPEPKSSALPWSQGIQAIRVYLQGDRDQPLNLAMTCLLLDLDVEVAIKSTGEDTARIHVRHPTRNRNALATMILIVNQVFGGKGQWEKRMVDDSLTMDHAREVAGMEMRI